MKRFIEFVELRTKITSVFPFFLTLAYLFYRRIPVEWELTLLFFGSMFLFDLTTTAINNTIDSKIRSNGETLPFSHNTAKGILYGMLAVSSGLGLFLAYRTDWVVLLAGGLCFVCGVCYTWGPIPIFRLPLGEIFSGLFYGLLIPFLLFYINLPAGTFLTLTVDVQTLRFEMALLPVVYLLLFSVGPVCATANIMLANNICDVKKDITAGRYTLPYFLGKSALTLFAGLYYAVYIANTLLVLLNILSPICLLLWLTIVPVHKNIRRFREEPDKGKTFVLSVQNYILLIGTQTVLVFVSGLFM